MGKKLLGHDPETGVTEYFHYDETSDTSYVETVQDVSGILDANKNLQNNDDYTRHGMKEEMWHYASIPIIVQMQWLKEYGMENWPMLPQNKKLLFRLLNSPDYQYLRCTPKIHVARS
jgi:hypothetical protein